MLFLVFLFSCLFVCCDNDNNNYAENIIGEWKLVKITNSYTLDTSFNPLSYDYSQYSIVYEFKRNSVLTVSGETDVIDIYVGHTIGKHSYSFVKDKDGYGMAGLPYGLKIDDHTYWYEVSSEKLIITMAPVDGNAYYFVKLK